MVASEMWVLMNYRIPREPSTPRIAIWRRLKRLGVVHLGDGLVGLPYDSSTKEALEWVANSVHEADGQATIWISTPTVARWGHDLADQMRAERSAEYDELMDRVWLASEDPDVKQRSIKALRDELRRIERRDYFPTDTRTAARAAIADLTRHHVEAEK